MARPKKSSQLPVETTQPTEPAPTPESVTVDIGNSLAVTLSKLIKGDEPANKKERIILSKWSHLTRWERLALAALWDLPGEQERNDRLARMAERKLYRL
jgi:hypothetical protein